MKVKSRDLFCVGYTCTVITVVNANVSETLFIVIYYQETLEFRQVHRVLKSNAFHDNSLTFRENSVKISRQFVDNSVTSS